MKKNISIVENWKNNWNFEKKMHLIIVNTISIIIAVAIIFSTFSSIQTIIQQNKESAREQLSTLAKDYENSLEQYRSMMIAIIMDSHVQRFCKGKSSIERNNEKQEVYNNLSTMLNAQYNANFVVVIDKSSLEHVYCGNIGISQSRFLTGYSKDYFESVSAKKDSSIRMNFANNFYQKNQYSLTLYFPIYSTTTLNHEMGMLVLNVQDDMLFQKKGSRYQENSNLYIVDMNGTVVSSQDGSKIGTKLVDEQKLAGEYGSFQSKTTYITYHKMGQWNYYLVNQMPILHLVRYSVSAAFIMLVCMIILMIVAMAVIHFLMREVKEEQHQMNQIRLNALHSQIQPHFLYNTLECIHWQAAADGNHEISTLVKALAQYYRICLNDGKDIIPLSKELDHIRNYIIIQNMRYDNIIHLDIDIAEEFQNVMLPKLTLQPLVENSIYHGIRVKEGKKGHVRITLEQGEHIIIRITDDGQGMEQELIDHINQDLSEFDEKIGYGINNVNKRIELLFGAEYGLHFSKGVETGLCVEIHLPIREKSEEYV